MNVMVYLNNEFKMKTIPEKDGSWDVDLGIISPGIYKLRIDETTINGDVKFRIETPFKQETKELIDKMFTKAITVQPGNSLWRIARRIYGKGIMYLDIYNKNSHLIKDPDLIYPGQIFFTIRLEFFIVKFKLSNILFNLTTKFWNDMNSYIIKNNSFCGQRIILVFVLEL